MKKWKLKRNCLAWGKKSRYMIKWGVISQLTRIILTNETKKKKRAREIKLMINQFKKIKIQ